jgi:hypothetical protein
MNKFFRMALVAVAITLLVPAAFAGKRPPKHLKALSGSLGTQSVSIVTPAAKPITFFTGLSNLFGETGTCLCPTQTGGCTPLSTFDNNATVYVSTYFTDISNGTFQSYLFYSAVKPDGFNVAIFNGVTVTFDNSGTPAGEDFQGCIYYSIQFPAFFAGRTFPWGGGILNGVDDKLQGQLGVLHLNP